MPEFSVGAQIFDVVFHPKRSIVYTGLLTGHIKAFSYDNQGNHKSVFSLRPSKRSCRGLSINSDGDKLYAVGKAKALNIIDTTSESIEKRSAAHDSPINRVKSLLPWLLATGDDEGVIKLWDPRQKSCLRTYTQHFDYISDFLWLEDKKQLVATSGDGTLSVMDVRSKKPEPIAQSEDQEDELLSIASIKSGSKVVVGTQIGILSIFNRSSGWGDCVDRIPGHPLSIDAICSLPPNLPNVDTSSTILTGSSDGYVRAVRILPTKMLGIVADHGDWPVERIAVGGGEQDMTFEGAAGGSNHIGRDSDARDDNEEQSVEGRQNGRWWVASAGHEDMLRMTDLEEFFSCGEREAPESQEEQTGDTHLSNTDDKQDEDNGPDLRQNLAEISDGETRETEPGETSSRQADSDLDEGLPQVKKRKRRLKEKDTGSETLKKNKAKKVAVVDKHFFDDL